MRSLRLLSVGLETTGEEVSCPPIEAAGGSGKLLLTLGDARPSEDKGKLWAYSSNAVKSFQLKVAK